MMLERRNLLIVLLLLILVACNGAAAPATEGVETAVEQVVQATEPPPTELPPPSATPAATPESAAAVVPALDIPNLVWAPFGSGTYGEPLLAVWNGELTSISEPDPAIETFFDYSPLRGLVAYGSAFWYAAANEIDSVTDLWVHDVTTGESVEWLSDNVGRAVWGPVPEEMFDGAVRPYLAVALHTGDSYDLILMGAPNDEDFLALDIDPFFSWSPDGQTLAFVRDGALFAMDIDTLVEVPLAGGLYESVGWIGDAPLWLNNDYILYADDPFTVVAVDGESVIVPEPLADVSVGDRPLTFLWEPDTLELIVEVEGDFAPEVQVYLLTDDFTTIIDSYTLGDDTALVGWFEQGVSIVVLEAGTPRIWSLLELDYVTP